MTQRMMKYFVGIKKSVINNTGLISEYFDI